MRNWPKNVLTASPHTSSNNEIRSLVSLGKNNFIPQGVSQKEFTNFVFDYGN
jgi:hypothetical protein